MIMKKSLLILLAGLMALAQSCEKNSVPDPDDNDMYDLSQVTIVDSGSIPLEAFYTKLLQDAAAHNGDYDQNLYDHYKSLLEQARSEGGQTKGDGGSSIPMATFSTYSTDGRLFMPVAVALLLKGAVDTDPRLRELGCKYEDLCSPEFMDTGIFGFLQGKDLSTDEVVPCSNLEAMEKSWSAVLQNFSSYRYTSGGTSYHKSAGTLFYISYSGTYTEEILSGKWTAVHKEL